MLCFIKNSVYFLFIICIVSNCNTSNKPIEIKQNIQDSSVVNTIDSFTILLSGIPPEQLYGNARDIVAKQYHINFIYAAACIVSDSLRDSISNVNRRNFLELEKHYHKGFANELFEQIDKENDFLIHLDSVLRNNKTPKTMNSLSNELIYYTKTNRNYLANFIVRVPDKKVLTFRLKLSATIDSAKKQVLTTTIKDSLINYNFKNLNFND